MAIGLGKKDLERRSDLVAELLAARGKIEDAVNVYNEALATLKAPVVAAIAELNTVLEEARGFAEDIAREADEAIDSHSERWQDGDKGQAARSFQQEWETVDLAEIDERDITWPEELKLDEQIDHDGRLENLPDGAEE